MDKKIYVYFRSILGAVWLSSVVYAVEVVASENQNACPDAALVSRDLVHAGIDSQELLEIIRRIDKGNIEGARSLATSYLDAQVQLIDQLSKASVSDDEKNKASEIVKRVNAYRAEHKTAESN